MDEPLSNLDALLRVQTREELLKLHRRVPGTVIYVTHDQVEALTMGDRIGVMRQGELMQVGTPEEVYQRPANLFVAGFVGSPQMNLIEGAVTMMGDKCSFAANGFSVPLLAPPVSSAGIGRCTLGVRPEALRVVAPTSTVPLRGIVSLVELAGADRFLIVDVSGCELRVRVDATMTVREGETVGLELAGGNPHLYGEDGLRLEFPTNASERASAVSSMM
jgi:ABC-type sugar transport system ATPase subunit